MFEAFIYTYVQGTVVHTSFLSHILNPQLIRQPVSESATGKKRTFKP